MIRIQVDNNKAICPDLGINVLDVCKEFHNDLPLDYPAMHLLTCHLQDLPCKTIVLLKLEFILHLIENDCPSLLLPNFDHLFYKTIEDFSDIQVILEAIVSEEYPPLIESTYNLKRIYRDRYLWLDKQRIK